MIGLLIVAVALFGSMVLLGFAGLWIEKDSKLQTEKSKGKSAKRMKKAS